MKLKRVRYFSVSVFVGLGCILLPNTSCKHDGIPADQMVPVSFTEVLPIFTSYCGKCHNGNRGESGYAYTDYSTIMKSITPGNASKSKAYQAMTSTIQIMPPDIAMPTSKRTLIRLWIEQGAKQN